ncbi:hypothetical protein [Roseicyclus mahoneyensis]|uniref:Uncharacterized protein n=1 Tax=Roseicyclus mahoneyensis TaxID=164332 RepID=A0A316GNX9_9RHOB|nr:hypothetical protein [Roseicyclus mahoneyensis]PWK62051.1 hypothetical protein C7455_10176 [Roseicyclus mahoneyensis]
MARRLFLERRTYRQARLQDAARLLPVLGLVLVFAPIFIRGDTQEAGVQISGWLIYYFTVWVGLIVLTGFVSRALMQSDRPEGAPPEATPAPETRPDPGEAR